MPKSFKDATPRAACLVSSCTFHGLIGQHDNGINLKGIGNLEGNIFVKSGIWALAIAADSESTKT